MKRMMIVLCTAGVMATAAIVRTQSVYRQASAQGGPAMMIDGLELFPGAMTTMALEGQIVKGIPYSAEIVTEAIQTLADGNRIVQRKTSRIYRDGQGRTRREDDRPSGGPAVSISDPVAGTAFTLDPASRTARETPMSVFSFTPNPLLFDYFAAGTRLLGGNTATFWTSQPPITYAYAPVRQRAGRGGASGDTVEEKMPDRVIEGVLATGVRRTTTIAKGAIGNEQPIKIVSEEWTSPELQVLVLTDYSDPRTGRSTYRLLKISRLEPDAALFQVPADYTIQRLSGKGRGRGGSGH